MKTKRHSIKSNLDNLILRKRPAVKIDWKLVSNWNCASRRNAQKYLASHGIQSRLPDLVEVLREDVCPDHDLFVAEQDRRRAQELINRSSWTPGRRAR